LPNNPFSITQVLYGEQSITDTLSRFLSELNGIDLCSDSNTIAKIIEIYKNKLLDHNTGPETKVRFLTDINKSNISLYKELMKVTREVRHLEGIKANFAVRNKEYVGIVSLRKGSQLDEGQLEEKNQLLHSQSHIIYSNVSGIIEQQQYLFNSLWEKAIPAERRIKELEEGKQSEFFDVVTDNKKITQILIDLVNSAANQIVLLLPNDKALIRIDRLGIIDSLVKASQNKIVVKIICPLSKENLLIQKKIDDNAPDILILNGASSRHGIYIVDNHKFLRVELVKPEAESFSEAIGFAVYSNSERSAELFRWMFELLWNDRIANEESKKVYKTEQEFVNVAAHELRSPAHSILAYAELLLADSKYKNDNEYRFLGAIYRNSLRLSKLTKDLLDLTRIDSQGLKLHKQRFNLKQVIQLVVEDIQRRKQALNLGINNGDSEGNAEIMLLPLIGGKKYDTFTDIVIEADMEWIVQVITNLLDNALRFTRKNNTISVNMRIKKSEKSREVVVSVRDNGTGIDPEIMPKLFTKFTTWPSSTSRTKGIGLGLYISKNIIEAHGGKIWAENNSTGKGATFSFSLPLSN
jgi:two-component system, OmpR family, sensor histidine kinase VicK